MRIIDRHIEYLLKRHDCVVVPGLGALLCRYESAHFDESGDRILPPGRRLAFNQWLAESDGLLESSVARRERISYEDAAALVRSEVSAILSEVESMGKSVIGRIGTICKGEELCFIADSVPGVNGSFYGLPVIEPRLLDAVQQRRPAVISEPSVEGVEEEVRPTVSSPAPWRAYASGIVATLAVVVTLALFVLSPIKVDKNTQTASIAPVAEVLNDISRKPVAPQAEVEMPVVEVESVESEVEPVSVAVAETTDSRDGLPADEVRFNDADKFIVVVASFPTREQADVYINGCRGKRLGVAEMGGKFRVFAATGAAYGEAMELARHAGVADAWVCRR